MGSWGKTGRCHDERMLYAAIFCGRLKLTLTSLGRAASSRLGKDEAEDRFVDNFLQYQGCILYVTVSLMTEEST